LDIHKNPPKKPKVSTLGGIGVPGSFSTRKIYPEQVLNVWRDSGN